MTEKVAKRIISADLPMPMCIVNRDGKVTSANRFIDRVFPYKGIEDADFFALTGIKIKSLLDGDNKYLLDRNGRKFRVIQIAIRMNMAMISLYFSEMSQDMKTLRRNMFLRKYAFVA